MDKRIKREWAIEELDFLSENYPRMSQLDIANVLGRRVSSVYLKLISLGLHKRDKVESLLSKNRVDNLKNIELDKMFEALEVILNKDDFDLITSRYFNQDWSTANVLVWMGKKFYGYEEMALYRIQNRFLRYMEHHKSFRFLFCYFFRAMLKGNVEESISRMETKTKLKRLTAKEHRKWGDKKAYQRALILTLLFIGYDENKVLNEVGLTSLPFLTVELSRAFQLLKEKSNILSKFIISVFENEIFDSRVGI